METRRKTAAQEGLSACSRDGVGVGVLGSDFPVHRSAGNTKEEEHDHTG